jgi:Flp pilus assembly CpaE family ATPase
LDCVKGPRLASAIGTGGTRAIWVCCSDQQMALALSVLLAQEAPEAHVTALTGLADLQARLDHPAGRFPGACFLEISRQSTEAFQLLARLTGPGMGIPAVALLGEDDHETALRCLRMGACGCLVHPMDRNQLLPILPRLGCAVRTDSEPQRGKVICVLPARGSSGATTLAANLACHAARSGSRRVLLADMDLLAGTLGFTLKVTSPHSFVDALGHAGDLDADLWKGLVVPYRGVDVLLSPDDPSECELHAAGLPNLVRYARRNYDLVVIDTGGVFGPLAPELASASDEPLLVTTCDVGVLHGAARSLAFLNAAGSRSGRARIVVNRWRREAGLDRSEIEAALGFPVFAVLPSDPQATEDALLEGRPLAPGSALGRAVAELASHLLEPDAPTTPPATSRGWRSLFSRAV